MNRYQYTVTVVHTRDEDAVWFWDISVENTITGSSIHRQYTAHAYTADQAATDLLGITMTAGV